MDFFSGLFLAISGFFGFNIEQSVAVPVPTAPAVVEEVDSETASSAEIVSGIGDVSEPDIVDTLASDTMVDGETVAESVPIADAMVGAAAKPIAVTTPDQTVPIGINIQTALVAGGCFWCVEADLEKTAGVISVVSGYAGGSTENPTYSNYGSGGHREVVEVTYDANQVSYEDLLIVTLKTTDPTDDDGTFGDRGDKYSSAFYYKNAEQKAIIDALITEVDANGPYASALAIDIEKRPTFWEAEERHQDYYKGTLTKLKYQFYRDGSGRTAFIKKHWGEDKSPNLPWRTNTTYNWSNYVKPDIATLEATMDATAFRVTQKDGTERAGTSPLDKVNDRGIFVDVLSGEPLYSSRDKFDSGTGWPSFVAPITDSALTEHEDRKLFSVRTETRSAIADNHIGHVFTDGPVDRGGLRYCMNGAAMRFVAEADMAAEGYGDFLSAL
jgi:peptide methionine sulfoxide reductase msrA/msrB